MTARKSHVWTVEDVEFVGAVYHVAHRGEIVAHYPGTGGWPNPVPEGHTLTRFPDPTKLAAYRAARSS